MNLHLKPLFLVVSLSMLLFACNKGKKMPEDTYISYEIAEETNMGQTYDSDMHYLNKFSTKQAAFNAFKVELNDKLENRNLFETTGKAEYYIKFETFTLTENIQTERELSCPDYSSLDYSTVNLIIKIALFDTEHNFIDRWEFSIQEVERVRCTSPDDDDDDDCDKDDDCSCWVNAIRGGTDKMFKKLAKEIRPYIADEIFFHKF